MILKTDKILIKTVEATKLTAEVPKQIIDCRRELVNAYLRMTTFGQLIEKETS